MWLRKLTKGPSVVFIIALLLPILLSCILVFVNFNFTEKILVLGFIFITNILLGIYYYYTVIFPIKRISHYTNQDDNKNHPKNSMMTFVESFDSMTLDLKKSMGKLISEKNERNKVTKELKKFQNDLDILVEERTEELKLAKDKSEKANKMKSEFLANISHEIRTPLQGIIGITELILNTELNKQQEEYIRNLEISGSLLLNMINDILDFSKIDSGQLELNKRDFTLQETFNELGDVFTVSAAKKQIELILDYDSEIPHTLVGDEGKLKQILLNLIGNALKFTEKGEVILKAKVTDYMSNWAEIAFSVKDTGIGIDKENQNDLFLPFAQGDNSTTKKYSGTGLGLAICKKLVELMKGKITINDKYTNGTEFNFNITFDVYDNDNKNNGKNSIDEKYKDIKILVIEDNKTSSIVIKHIIKNLGMQPIVVHSGKDALKRLNNAVKSKKPFDFILSDIMMPNMNGFELTKAIRKNPSYQNTNVMLMSALGTQENSDIGAKIGVDGFLTKPVKPSLLKDMIDQIIFQQEAGIKIKNQKMLTQTAIRMRKFINKRLLLVEDNNINRRILQEVLKQYGFATYTVKNGKEAIDILQKDSFDAILMDCQMPIMDGFEATSKIRSMELDENKIFTKTNENHIPIIAMTANTSEDDMQKCFSVGMDDYVSKPIDKNILFSIIDKWISFNTGSGFFNKITDSNEEHPLQNIFLKNLKGIDIKDALERVNNSEEILFNLITEFAENFSNLAKEINQNIKNNNYKDAQEKVHSIKGVSANLSLTDIYECAIDLEKAIKENSKKIDLHKGNFSNALNFFISQIDIRQAEIKTETINIKELLTKKTIPMFLELKELISTHDLYAENLLLEIKTLFPENKLIFSLHKSVSKFDFDKAGAILQETILKCIEQNEKDINEK